MKFELDLFSKKNYFWEETAPDGAVTVSDEYRIREDMLKAMHKTMSACTVNGTVFQPMVRQNSQSMEWGAAEKVDRHFCLVNDDGEEIADVTTLETAVSIAERYDERLRIMDKERSKIFHIKERH